MPQTSLTADQTSAGLTSPQTPPTSPEPRSFFEWTPPKLTRGEKKEAKKEAKRAAKAHQQALRSGPLVGGVIIDPSPSVDTSTSPPASRPSAVPQALRANTPSNEQLNADAEYQQTWSLEKLLQYIIDHDILLHPDDKEMARNFLQDRRTMMTFLNKIEAVKNGGEIPSAEEISSAEGLAARNGSLLTRPFDWTKDDFMEVIGLRGSDNEAEIPNVEWEDEGSTDKGKGAMTRSREWEAEEGPSPSLRDPAIRKKTAKSSTKSPVKESVLSEIEEADDEGEMTAMTRISQGAAAAADDDGK